MGFWDDAVKEVGPRNSTNKNKNNASLSKSVGVSNRQNKKVEEEEKLLKLFQGVNKAQDGFTQWCEQMLHALNTADNLDGKNWGGNPSMWFDRAGHLPRGWQVGTLSQNVEDEIYGTKSCTFIKT